MEELTKRRPRITIVGVPVVLTDKEVFECIFEQNIADKFHNAMRDSFLEKVKLSHKSDEKNIEMLRLFMDGSCGDWYSSMIIKLTMNSEWLTWKNKFCETFENKGWNPVTYALLFKYKDGSLLDYAMKKGKHLLGIGRSTDTGKENLEADCLSRNPVLESNENTDERLKIVNLIKLEDIFTDQNKNKEI
ncbi:unnamed protein product [Parnassius mnemosyne]|uniref:Uncharacterized protein n=1 Tax=Parnassius mnemosyne TaxID=213953 RepID=A0AAV1M1V0_9NEOP